ncbi:YeeE/YedE family protein [Sinorhizobium fredii]|uniref:YeeE/YedE family protein n=1 Tax=Rhizobium fredii TaxID=380 RepID=UPI001FCC0BE3|nr:YeeE/YedE family protein [Sinorhizobium fredii]
MFLKLDQVAIKESLVNTSAAVAAGTEIWAGTALLGVIAFVLGFALNHASICTVIATKELISEKKPARFIALVECAVWAALAYAMLGIAPMMQEGWLPLSYFVPAAILFGLGTYVNGTCVFGSVGHIGNGETEFGFALLSIFAVFYIESRFGLLPDQPPISGSPPLGAVLLALALLAILALRLGVSLQSRSDFWRLTLSMGAIGITSTILAVFAPEFSITASVGSIVSIPVAGAVILVCMFSGSLASARVRKHRFTLKWPTIKGTARRTLGGILMGLGALLIPGGNDTVLLIGLPMGAWQAALAYALFVATLAALIAKFGSMARSWS